MPLGIIRNASGALFTAATTFASFALPGLSKISTPPLIDWRVGVHHQELGIHPTGTSGVKKVLTGHKTLLNTSKTAQVYYQTSGSLETCYTN